MKIYPLIAHLKKCPPDFLQESNLHVKDGVHTEALIADVYRKVIGESCSFQFNIPQTATFKKFSSAHLISIQIACWLLSHEVFRGGIDLISKIDSFFSDDLAVLSKHVKPYKWITDDERTEELVRLALKCCAFLPEGETSEEAADQFDALSTIKRLGVLTKSTEAFERMKEIRRKMAEKKAREAANPYGRE